MYSNEAMESQRVRSVVGSVNGKSTQRRTGGNNQTATSRLFMNAVKDASKSARHPGERSEENVSYRSDRSERHSKRPYSPTMDYHKEDQKIKSRRVENEVEYDLLFDSQDRYSRVGFEHRINDQGLYIPSPPDYERSRYGNYKIFVNERRPSQQNVRPLQQPISVLDRLGKKGGLMTAYINPAFIQGSSAANTNAIPFPSDSNNNITLTPKTSRCRHWPNCDLGSTCKFHHPTEICPMVPNCPNSPKTCLYIHPANQDFVSYDQRGSIYRPGAFVNGTGQGAFGPRSSGLGSFGHGSMSPMSHGMFGQSSSYQSGAFGSGVFGQNSQRPSVSHEKNTFEQTSNVQNQREKEKKSANIISTDTIKMNQIFQAPFSVTPLNTMSAESSCEKNAVTQHKTIPSAQNASPAVLCKFSENCANPNCLYAHASPASVRSGFNTSTLVDIPCKFGSECTQPKCCYSHPSPAASVAAQDPCRYYPNCQNLMCPYLHIDYNHTIKVPAPCRNGAHCARPGCHFMHPWDMETDTSSIPCKFGFNCRRPDCAYAHPIGKKKYSHISERTFAVPEDMTEKVLPFSENQEEHESIDKAEGNWQALNSL
ncbi:1864_t:CDS:10 [Funneliformis geosporum]|nr:1864_t:CDS:10 [Funneliformis geosporum]